MKKNNIAIITKQFAREKKAYLVSEILTNESPPKPLNDHQAFLYQRLTFSIFEWNQESPSEEIQELKNKLSQYEAFVNETASDLASLEFDSFTSQQHFECIEEIECEIGIKLKKHFNFEIPKIASREIMIELKGKILQFYNFLVSSNIISKDNLLQLIYRFGMFGKNDSSEREDDTLARTIGAMYQDKNVSTAIIGIDFHKTWTDKNLMQESYNNGQLTSSDFFGIFVHEFAHAISDFYSLAPNLKEIVNLNIIDSQNNDIFEENALQKIHYHFLKLNKTHQKIDVNYIVDMAWVKLMQKIGSNEDFRNRNFMNFATWTLSPSWYGRTLSDKYPNNSLYLEWFAEGFAYWYTEVQEQRNKIWEFWHNYFIHEFVK